jgi:hypothetical protein
VAVTSRVILDIVVTFIKQATLLAAAPVTLG